MLKSISKVGSIVEFNRKRFRSDVGSWKVGRIRDFSGAKVNFLVT